jgi:hypothetical protein
MLAKKRVLQRTERDGQNLEEGKRLTARPRASDIADALFEETSYGDMVKATYFPRDLCQPREDEHPVRWRGEDGWTCGLSSDTAY